MEKTLPLPKGFFHEPGQKDPVRNEPEVCISMMELPILGGPDKQQMQCVFTFEGFASKIVRCWGLEGGRVWEIRDVLTLSGRCATS